jgi:hypothetical protein
MGCAGGDARRGDGVFLAGGESVRHVVNFSGGVSSWAAAKRVAERHGTADLVLLFADTLYEDEDTYRFLNEAAQNIGVPLTRIADGRNPWEVFHDERFLGNSRLDPCSKILKRRLIDRWCKENCDKSDTILYFGIHWSESDRFDDIQKRLSDWKCAAPLCEPPFVGAEYLHHWAEQEGLQKQLLYELGFSHANCGGRCVKGGQAHWARVWRFLRHRFLEAERGEIWMSARCGQPVTILKERVGIDAEGKAIYRPLPLSEFRRRLENDQQYDMFDVGGCGCFAGTLEAV